MSLVSKNSKRIQKIPKIRKSQLSYTSIPSVSTQESLHSSEIQLEAFKINKLKEYYTYSIEEIDDGEKLLPNTNSPQFSFLNSVGRPMYAALAQENQKIKIEKLMKALFIKKELEYHEFLDYFQGLKSMPLSSDSPYN